MRVTRAGADVAEASVLVDGKEVAKQIDGKPIAINPGPHTILVRVGAEERTQKVVVSAGQKARSVEFELTPAAPSPPPPVTPGPTPLPIPESETASGGSTSPLVWIGYGVGLAGLVAGSVTGGISLAQASDIEDQCTEGRCPASTQDDIDRGTLLAHVSTASFAVGAVGLALGTVGLFLGGDDDEVVVQAGLGYLQLGGRF